MKSIIIAAMLIFLINACTENINNELSTTEELSFSYDPKYQAESLIAGGSQYLDENCTLNTADYFQWSANGDNTFNLRADNIPGNWANNRLGEVFWALYAPDGCTDAHKTIANKGKVSAYEIEQWIILTTRNTERQDNIDNADVEPEPAWT